MKKYTDIQLFLESIAKKTQFSVFIFLYMISYFIAKKSIESKMKNYTDL